MTRGPLHARTLVATSRIVDEQIELGAPSPGLFRSAVQAGDIVRGGGVLGILEILGQPVQLLAPDVGGAVVALRDPQLARVPVGHGATLVTLDPRATALGARATAATQSAAQTTGLVFRAPTSGRFYGRSSPDKPAFVSTGDELVQGATICLLEVMKTFHRVTYGGAGLPERARVREILVADGADVSAGDPLLALE